MKTNYSIPEWGYDPKEVAIKEARKSLPKPQSIQELTQEMHAYFAIQSLQFDKQIASTTPRKSK